MKRIGLDIGSTTIKCAVIDEHGELIYQAYERHLSHITEKTKALLEKVEHDFIHEEPVYFAVSGSAGMGLADKCSVPFVQEVYAERIACTKLQNDTDCIIELGGEDAKILFLTNGLEVRMNGTCAGGTGAFIDQMATLLKMTPEDMNNAANQAKRTYSIASRCGVFAKSDVQPLINQGADINDICLSIYQAVVNQTIAGLAQGREIKGNVLYLGGPLSFCDSLRRCFDSTLEITGTCPENSLYYVAFGAAFYADECFRISDILVRLKQNEVARGYQTFPALFENRDEYWKFHMRHAKASVPVVPFPDDGSPVHIGIDSGSTTIKIVVINDKKQLLFKDYQSNDGNPIPIVRSVLMKLWQEHPGLTIASVTTTGYGEELMKTAFHADYHIVETVAHYTAAQYFMPDVDFIIDIGGQDMKCFRIENGAVSDIFLNEACSSGCGSFLQTFANALGFTVEEFAMQGLFAKEPVDLGSRCTVFMNSSVKQVQKDGADLASISAGLSSSIVKNALYKVIRISSLDQLGKKIVVQGGTFYNEAVLRAFEKELGTEVIRPDIAGLMGAYGAALHGLSKAKPDQTSTVLNEEALKQFSHSITSTFCNGCGNHCQLTINTFSDGSRLISGNRCEKPVTGKEADDHLNLFAWKKDQLSKYQNNAIDPAKRTIGIPLCLNMYELLPFWHTFWTELGFNVLVSPFSSKEIYRMGQMTIPSDTACFPAKLTHGHIAWLLQKQPDAIFYPCMSYNFDESLGDNHYNCPMVAYYPEVLSSNISALSQTRFIYDYIDLSRPKEFLKRMPDKILKYFPDLKKAVIRSAIHAAYETYRAQMDEVHQKGQEIIEQARMEGKRIIVLAGRPYHIDPEVSHGIERLITKQNAAVVSEDSVSWQSDKAHVNVLNQWTYHSRLYAAAKYCTQHEDTDLIQLVSFGCGLDAITTDETKDILNKHGKLYTQLKIDEITNMGAVNIRIRSLFAALEEKERNRHG